MPDPRAEPNVTDMEEVFADINDRCEESLQKAEKLINRLVKENRYLRCRKITTAADLTKKDWYKMIETIDDPYLCDTMISRLTARQHQIKEELDINFKSHTPKEIKAL